MPAAADGATPASLQRELGAAVETAITRFENWRRAIASGGFSLAFQPIVALADRRAHHHEALVRFPAGEEPLAVVRFGEEAGLIEELDLAITDRALSVLADAPWARLAVNLSGRSVQSPAFRAGLAGLLSRRRALLGRLMFELTETHAIEQVAAAAEFLKRLRDDGCSVCLDDFGAGAAAYHYLRHFDVDFVKIDGPFLKAAAANDRDRRLVRSICGLCSELGIGVIGEMIEDEPAAMAAAALGIGYGQGRLFGAPMAGLTAAPRKGETDDGPGGEL